MGPLLAERRKLLARVLAQAPDNVRSLAGFDRPLTESRMA
jgi:hypothetical protein